MRDLVEWLLACIAEDEQVAQAAQSPRGATIFTDPRRGGKQAMLDHIARHDPARVLAVCQAHRTILGVYTATYLTRAQIDYDVGDPDMNDVMGPLRDVVRALAAAYADRPGYRQDWHA